MNKELMRRVYEREQQEPFDALLAFASIEKMRRELGDNLPNCETIRQFRPKRSYFLRPEKAVDPRDLHHEGHIADTLILGANLTRLRRGRDPRSELNEILILEALAHHDTRVDGEENYHLHAGRAAENFIHTDRSSQYSGVDAQAIALLIAWHPLRTDPPIFEDQTHLLQMLYTLQDADASMLGRPDLRRPIDEIFLRTYDANKLHFPHIGGLLCAVGEEIGIMYGTDDLFENEIMAATQLRLLHP